MKIATITDRIERLEDQLQAIKWVVRPPQPTVDARRRAASSIVNRTAGLLRGRVPDGVTYQRRLRREWERRLKREHA